VPFGGARRTRRGRARRSKKRQKSLVGGAKRRDGFSWERDPQVRVNEGWSRTRKGTESKHSRMPIGSANAACGRFAVRRILRAKTMARITSLWAASGVEIIAVVHSAVALRIAGARFSQDSHNHLLDFRK
jgi:hypothetical protein